MRSTRGKTRAQRVKATPHVTPEARITAPLTSTEPVESRKGQTPPRDSWRRQGNTNLQLSRGGMSCYPRMRERGYSLPMTESRYVP